MKKFFVLLMTLFCLSVIPVDAAEEVNVNVLYPVSSSYNVITEHFNYENVIYNPVLDGNGNTTITIGKVYNSTNKRVPISIRIGLFDSEKKNIGVVNYCSTRDTESDYSYKMLLANEETPFYVKVSSKKNISKDKKLEDVAYIAVLDDNKDCSRDGMENKYTGLTIEEIVDGQVSTKVEKLLDFDFLKKLGKLDFSGLKTGLIIFAVIILIIYIIQAKILNALHMRMYNKTTALVYIPIANLYVAVKLSFGPAIAKIYIICYLLSSVLGFFVPLISLLTSLFSFVGGVAFIIVIIKLITKKYDMLYFENMKAMKTKLSDGINSTMEINRTINNDNYDIDNEEFLDNLNRNTDDSSSKQSKSDDLLASLGVDLHGNTKSIEDSEDDDSGGKFFNISPSDIDENSDEENLSLGGKSEDDGGFSLGNSSKSDDKEGSSSLEDLFK